MKYIDQLIAENNTLKGEVSYLELRVGVLGKAHKDLEAKLSKLRDTDWIEKADSYLGGMITDNGLLQSKAFELIQEELKCITTPTD